MRVDDVRDFFERVDGEPSSQFSAALLARLQEEYLQAAPDMSPGTALPTLEDELPVIELVNEEPRRRRERRGPVHPNGRPRRRIAIAAAAVAVLIVGAAIVVRNVRNDGVKVIAPAGPGPAVTTPASRPPLPHGLGGLPPGGAIPSTPETGQLLAKLAVPIWVYEDGRVISARWTTGSDWTGFLEQRLSPAGVELVRAEILANGPIGTCGGTMGWYVYMDGERAVCERPGESTYMLNGGLDSHVSKPPDSSGYFRLWELPYGAPSWLPASAWTDPEPKPFVPSKYKVQVAPVSAQGAVQLPMDVQSMLAYLPAPATDLLTAQSRCTTPTGEAYTCEVSTEDARMLDATLGITAQAGADPTDRGTLMGRFGTYGFSFVPYLPHGSPVWCCGG